MAVRVRLTRVGAKKNPIWRIVVADQRSPRDGRFIEMIGHYNPQTQPSQIVIDRDRLEHWLERGAEPSNTVKKLMRAQNTEEGATAGGPATAVAEAPPAEPEAAEPDPAAPAEPEAAAGEPEPAAEVTEAATEPAGPTQEAAGAEAEQTDAAEETEAAADAEPASEGDAESG
jgi:small subunit ribosomal protein S16